MTYDDLIAQAYPWLAAMQPPPELRFAVTAANFLALQAIVRGNERPTAIQEITEYERWLLSIRAVLPSVVTLDDLGTTLARLHRDYDGVRPVELVEWLYRELMAGKPWEAVRDSDPRHPAPEPKWATPDFGTIVARLNAMGKEQGRC